MTTTARPRWITTTDVAKLVRARLRTHWDGKGPGNPDGWKYSVRSDKYSGGSAVRVTVPADFPEEAERALYRDLMPWGSVGFDGMTDSTYGKSHTLCPAHGVRLVGVGAHWGSSETSHDRCCEHAEDVHMGASYVTVQRDWR